VRAARGAPLARYFLDDDRHRSSETNRTRGADSSAGDAVSCSCRRNKKSLTSSSIQARAMGDASAGNLDLSPERLRGRITCRESGKKRIENQPFIRLQLKEKRIEGEGSEWAAETSSMIRAR